MLILIVCLWFGQGQASPAQNQSPAQTQQQAAQNPSPVIERAEAGQARNDSQQNQSKPAQWSDPLVVLNLALFVAVLIQAGIYWKQLGKMKATLIEIKNQGKTLRRQAVGTVSQARFTQDALVETRKMVEKNAEVVAIMEKQLIVMSAASDAQVDFAVIEGKATERSVKAAEDSVEVTRQNMIYAQRPYVSVIGGGLTDKGHGFQVVIKNCGSTPATEVFIKHVVDIGYSPPDLKGDGSDDWESAGVLAPNGTYDIATRLKRTITSEEQRLLGTPDEEFRLWCVGEIYYWDFFNLFADSGNARVTKFCVFRELGNPMFRAWSAGNDAT